MTSRNAGEGGCVWRAGVGVEMGPGQWGTAAGGAASAGTLLVTDQLEEMGADFAACVLS